MQEETLRAIAEVWATAATLPDAEVVRRIDALVAGFPDNGNAVFEAASARDYAGLETQAEPLYRRAIALGLVEPQSGRAVIQLASTVRNLGRPEEAIELLQGSFGAEPDHPLVDAARAFLALCLADTGDTRGATAVALDALAGHLPEYQRSVRSYAAALVSGS